jgi:hypothetical protein
MFEPVTSWGLSFLHPRLTRTGILVSSYCFTWERQVERKVMESTTETVSSIHTRLHERSVTEVKYTAVAKSTRDVFEWPKHPEQPMKISESEKEGTVWEIPATKNNLRLLMELPCIREEDRIAASEILVRWLYEMERLCFWFIGQKAATEPYPKVFPTAPDASRSGSHRVPMRAVSRTVTKTRELTKDERLLAAVGKRVPSKQERTSTEKQTVMEPYLLEWYRYAKHLKPFSQQLIGAEAAYSLRRLGIWYDMRVGKTLLAQMVGRRLLDEDEIDLILVICPRSNMYDPWTPECEKEGFEVRILDGTVEEDEDAILERHRERDPYPRQPEVYVINYERLGSRLTAMTQAWDMSRVMVIADETSAIKNPEASRAKAMHELCDWVEYVLLLNGTPMEQGPQDLWSQYRCLDRYGLRWGKTWHAHERKWLMQMAPGKYIPKDRMAFEMLIATTSIRYVRGEADQFSGKDKSFRYVELKGTKQMIEQSENVNAGFIKEMASGELQSVSSCILAKYMMLREICCGYDKYREIEHGPYLRVRHEIDPKLLWVRCFIEANPTTPVVLACEFNEQEERLKEMLEGMGVTWSGTKAKGRYDMRRRVREDVPVHLKVGALEFVHEQYRKQMEKVLLLPEEEQTEALEDVIPPPQTDEGFRYHSMVIEWLKQHPGTLESYMGFIGGKKHDPRTRAYEIERFNTGATHVFICKTSEMRGMSLARKEAVAEMIGTWPDLIFLAPCWSLGMWDQAQDRCVAVDPRTGKNVCTNIYALGIKGSIEELIYTALRSKKDVQQTLLKDAERKGYSNFINDLVEGMRQARENTSDSDYFDTEEMICRILCGVPPYSKLTDSLVLNKLSAKLSRNKKETREWLDIPDAWYLDPPPVPTEIPAHPDRELIRAAYAYLMSRVSADAKAA